MTEQEGQWFEAFGLLQHRGGPPVLELPGVNHARAVEYFGREFIQLFAKLSQLFGEYKPLFS